MAVFFTSDHHFGDARRLGIDRRPFADVAGMDRAMSENWNRVVAPGDTVWHLGDVTRWRDAGRIKALLDGLHGQKHLVVGNNDGPETLGYAGWITCSHYAEIEVDGVPLVLCHYPFRTWNGMGRGRIDLHGHSHGRLKAARRQYDVGVDARAFTPVALQELTRASGPRATRGRRTT